MKKIFEYWKEGKSGREGYTIAEIEFAAENFISETGDTTWYGEKRKTLRAAINDGKRYFAKHPNEYIIVYAWAKITPYYNDGTQRHKSYDDCVSLGSIDPNGNYFDFCTPVDWM